MDRYGVIVGILVSSVLAVNGLMLAARSLETIAGFAPAFGIVPKWAALELLVLLVPASWRTKS
jgi:hypothetical protein